MEKFVKVKSRIFKVDEIKYVSGGIRYTDKITTVYFKDGTETEFYMDIEDFWKEFNQEPKKETKDKRKQEK